MKARARGLSASLDIRAEKWMFGEIHAFGAEGQDCRCSSAQNRFTSFICAGLVQRTFKSCGEPTIIANALARERATLSRC
jgi:hypothetical protein